MANITSINKGENNSSNNGKNRLNVNQLAEYGVNLMTTEVMNLTSNDDAEKIKKNYSKFSSIAEITTYVGENTDYTPQGVCTVNGAKFITEYKDDKKPKLIYIDRQGNRKVLDLDLPEDTHAGGIAYMNGKLYISSKDDKVAVFDYNQVITSSEGKKLEPSYILDLNIPKASYLTTYNGKLYVGTFDKKKNGVLKEYADVNGELSELNSFAVPPKIQGVTFAETKSGETKMFLSQSFNRNKDSKILIYDYDPGAFIYSENKAETITAPPMLEQISFNPDGKMDCLFESCAEKYNDGKYQIDSLYTLDMSAYLK